MKTRPWPIVLLAAFQIVAPFWSVLISALVYRMTPSEYLVVMFRNQSFLEIISFFGLVPLAGFAIYSMKKWSYSLFLAIMLYVAIGNFMTWRASPDLLSISSLLGVYALNIALVSYFLVPAVRTTYFNPRVRWWESKPRYTVNSATRIQSRAHGAFKGMIEDLSEGGAFLKTSKTLAPGEVLLLRTELMGREQELPGRVVYRRPGVGYGVQFHFRTYEDRLRARRLAKALEYLGVPRRPEKTDWIHDLQVWVVRAFTKGEGWLPELPAVKPAMKSAVKKEPKLRTVVARSARRGKSARRPSTRSRLAPKRIAVA